MSRVTCQTKNPNFDKVVKLVGGGFVINVATPSSFCYKWICFFTIREVEGGSVVYCRMIGWMVLTFPLIVPDTSITGIGH